MKVGDIMNRAPVTVRSDQTFGEGLARLLQSRQPVLPCVDPQGIYKGIFDLKDVWDILLPKAAQLNRKSLEDLSFVSSSIDKMKDQVSEAAAEPIARFLNTEDAPVLHPDSPLIQAILLFDDFGPDIAVVDRHTRKLAGVVSAWQLLDSLR